jgi:hypothetical protein
MKTYRGNLLVTTYIEDRTQDQTVINTIIFKVEQYINDKVAMELYKKFGVLVRLHMKGGK